MKVSATGWFRRCPRCLTIVKPTRGTVYAGPTFYLFFECRCGRGWGEEVPWEVQVTEIGGRRRPRLPIKQRE